MSRLASSQSTFAQALTDPDRSAPTDVRRPGSNQAAQTKRFDVYRNNVAVAAIDTLRDIFPAVLKLVGDEFFQATAQAYIDHAPPSSPLLFQYGDTFGAFLDDFPPAASVPYLGDVARLEFARLQAYHAADATPLAISALAEIPSDEVAAITLVAHPAVSLIRSRYPVVSLWGASVGLASSDDVDMACAEDALTVRPELDVDTLILPTGGANFLDSLLEGDSLGIAAEAGAAAEPDFDLSAHLAGLFDAGTFERIGERP